MVVEFVHFTIDPACCCALIVCLQTLEKCAIFDSASEGVLVSDSGRGVFTECEIYGNRKSGVMVNSAAQPQFDRCTIFGGRADGVTVPAFESAVLTYFVVCWQ